MKRVLLISPAISGEIRCGKFKKVDSYLPPYGISSIAAVLESHGHVVKVVDADSRKGMTLNELNQSVIEFNPQIIGMTVYSIVRDIAIQTAEHIQSYSSAPVVAGGPHIMAFPKDLAPFDCFDIPAYSEFFLRSKQIWRLLRSVDSFEDIRKYLKLTMAFIRLYI
jgi:radical SAM superfamily enzyme YgiQ (UPF0313 family)